MEMRLIKNTRNAGVFVFGSDMRIVSELYYSGNISASCLASL